MENIGQIDIEKLTYEEAFDMMKLFEDGTRLYRHCNAILEKTEMKISKFNEYKEEVEVD